MCMFEKRADKAAYEKKVEKMEKELSQKTFFNGFTTKKERAELRQKHKKNKSQGDVFERVSTMHSQYNLTKNVCMFGDRDEDPYDFQKIAQAENKLRLC